jgi:uncharacterized protein
MKSYIMITGATGGLGSSFAAECAQKGFDLVLTDLMPKGNELAIRLSQKYGVEVRYFACDLTSDQARTDLFKALSDEGLRFWGLINVAGLDYEGAYIEKNRNQILRILKVNLLANMDMAHEILQLRDTGRKFRLINTCSMAGFYPMPFKATYAATKRFLLDFSIALNEEIKAFGSVTALCPGGMPTTTECMRAIFVQGYWGWATTMDAQKVAHLALKAALKGKVVYIPGFTNKFMQAVSALLPTASKVKLVASRWRTTQENIANQDFLAGRNQDREISTSA